MITEQQLKDQCTPEIIKKMVEFAEGFEWDGDQFADDKMFRCPNGLYYYWADLFLSENVLLFSTLIHRAVEGFNNTFKLKIRIFEDEVMTKEKLDHFAKGFYPIKNYQSEDLTHAECAILNCLIDIFEEKQIEIIQS